MALGRPPQVRRNRGDQRPAHPAIRRVRQRPVVDRAARGPRDGREPRVADELARRRIPRHRQQLGRQQEAAVGADAGARGRAGRQGDPGESRFFLSLEDDLLVRYGIQNLLRGRFVPGERDQPIDDPVVSEEIARAQRIIEGQNFDVRKTLSRYSSVVEEVMSQERVPPGYRYFVKRYFNLIKPRD